MSQKIKCPVCDSLAIVSFLSRNQLPVHQNLLVKERDSAVGISRGDLDLGVCQDCGFIFNQAFKLSKLQYGENYENNQGCSGYFGDYLDDLARYLLTEKGVRNSHIVEVGCGQGQFLRKLVEPVASGNSGYGFDPSYVGPSIDLGGRLKFENRYYGPDSAHVRADVVICRHVIEHVPDPASLLTAIRQSLVNSPHARIFFETPCVEWILRNQVIWDFFYEHCSYFTRESLTTLFERSGFQVEHTRHVFGGQYIWLEATVSEGEQDITRVPGSVPELAQQFSASESRLKAHWKEKVDELVARGPVALWGAGAKGATFLNLLDADCRLISCVVDVNPRKQKHYIPGTGHPIVHYQELRNYEVKAAISMNPNYSSENLALLKEAHLDIDLVDLN